MREEETWVALPASVVSSARISLTGRGYVQRALGGLGEEGVWVIWHDRDKGGCVSKGRFRRGDRREFGEQRSWRKEDSLVGQGEVQEPGA